MPYQPCPHAVKGFTKVQTATIVTKEDIIWQTAGTLRDPPNIKSGPQRLSHNSINYRDHAVNCPIPAKYYPSGSFNLTCSSFYLSSISFNCNCDSLSFSFSCNSSCLNARSSFPAIVDSDESLSLRIISLSCKYCNTSFFSCVFVIESLAFMKCDFGTCALTRLRCRKSSYYLEGH